MRENGGGVMGYCENCGSKSYGGACVNCHEEHYIMEQIERDYENEYFLSQEFADKVTAQRQEIKEAKKTLDKKGE